MVLPAPGAPSTRIRRAWRSSAKSCSVVTTGTRLVAQSDRAATLDELQRRAGEDERGIDARVVGTDAEVHEVVAGDDAAEFALIQHVVLAARGTVDARWQRRALARDQ